MDFQIPRPPDFLLWAAILGVGLNFIKFLWDLYQKRMDRQQSIVDMFWYRTVIMPICWSPLADLINEYVKHLHQMDRKAPLDQTLEGMINLAREFGREKNLVLGRFLLLTIFKDETYKNIRDTLDGLEDEIVQNCVPAESNFDSSSTAIAFIESLFWSNLTKACKEMMKLHPRGSVPL